MEVKRGYKMTNKDRDLYMLLLLSGREQEALQFREKMDKYWSEHADEFEKLKLR